MTSGTHVLILEDDPLIAMDLEDELTDRGFAVHCATSVAKARALLQGGVPSVAVLDMHLRGETSFELATELRDRAVPFFFLSGNDATALPPHLTASTIVTKPANMSEVARLIERLTSA